MVSASRRFSDKEEWEKVRVAVVDRVRDPDTGMDLLDPTTQKPIIHTHTEEKVIPVYDDVDLNTVKLRDFEDYPGVADRR